MPPKATSLLSKAKATSAAAATTPAKAKAGSTPAASASAGNKNSYESWFPLQDAKAKLEAEKLFGKDSADGAHEAEPGDSLTLHDVFEKSSKLLTEESSTVLKNLFSAYLAVDDFTTSAKKTSGSSGEDFLRPVAEQIQLRQIAAIDPLALSLSQCAKLEAVMFGGGRGADEAVGSENAATKAVLLAEKKFSDSFASLLNQIKGTATTAAGGAGTASSATTAKAARPPALAKAKAGSSAAASTSGNKTTGAAAAGGAASNSTTMSAEHQILPLLLSLIYQGLVLRKTDFTTNLLPMIAPKCSTFSEVYDCLVQAERGEQHVICCVKNSSSLLLQQQLKQFAACIVSATSSSGGRGQEQKQNTTCVIDVNQVLADSFLNRTQATLEGLLLSVIQPVLSGNGSSAGDSTTAAPNNMIFGSKKLCFLCGTLDVTSVLEYFGEILRQKGLLGMLNKDSNKTQLIFFTMAPASTASTTSTDSNGDPFIPEDQLATIHFAPAHINLSRPGPFDGASNDSFHLAAPSCLFRERERKNKQQLQDEGIRSGSAVAPKKDDELDKDLQNDLTHVLNQSVAFDFAEDFTKYSITGDSPNSTFASSKTSNGPTWLPGPNFEDERGNKLKPTLISAKIVKHPVQCPQIATPCLQLVGGAANSHCTGLYHCFFDGENIRGGGPHASETTSSTTTQTSDSASALLIRPNTIEFTFTMQGKIEFQNACVVFTEKKIENRILPDARVGVQFTVTRGGLMICEENMNSVNIQNDGKLKNDKWCSVKLQIDWKEKKIIPQVDSQMKGKYAPAKQSVAFRDKRCNGFGYVYLYNCESLATFWLQKLRVANEVVATDGDADNKTLLAMEGLDARKQMEDNLRKKEAEKAVENDMKVGMKMGGFAKTTGHGMNLAEEQNANIKF
ncbi:unnamed protein product [Amoebophrya sp. A120]|nr:unnamed protein product [Amoebophrya sp. A120]|eukprot:GSA120T00025624001.1